MARRRRRRARRRNQWVLTIIAFGIAFFFHDVWLDPLLDTSPRNADQQTHAPPPLTTSRPENDSLDGGPRADVPERAADPTEASSFTGSKEQVQHAASLIASARNALESGDKILARAHYSEALESGSSSSQEIEARAELRKLGLETILSGNEKITSPEPYISHHPKGGWKRILVSGRERLPFHALASEGNVPSLFPQSLCLLPHAQPPTHIAEP